MSIIKGIFSGKKDERSINDIDLEALFAEFYERLVYFAFQLLKDRDQAEDIVQEAFIKYWDQRDSVLNNKTAIKNFLYRTVRNASLNSVRHYKIVEGYVLQYNGTEPEEAPVIDAIIAAETISGLYAAVNALPENYRIVSVMGYLEGKKNHEIADELDISVNTIKKQKQKALQLLRLKLEPEMLLLLLALAFILR